MSGTTVLIVLVISAILLFLSMVLSAMASSAAADCTDDTAHRYAMYAAILCGISVVVMSIAIGVYYYRDEIRTSVGKGVKKIGKHIKGTKS